MRSEETTVEGRNAVLEAFRSGKTIEKLFVLDGCKDGPVQTILREARRQDTIVTFVSRERLDQLSQTGKHQGVIAHAAAWHYTEIADMLRRAREKGEDPFLFVLDGIEDPYNLGAIIRTANQAGAHGVIIPKRRSVGLTYAVGKASAGAVEYLPVARVGNLPSLLEELKARGLWIYAADMDGSPWCQTDFTGPTALVIGSEGRGVGRLVKEKADFVVSLPLKGNINSLNASVAAGILCYEVARQRSGTKAFNP